MGKTKISWTATVLPDGTVLPGYSFNPWIGCTKVSQGCKLCYAETQNKRYGWTDGWGPGAPRKRTSESNWKKPIQWDAQAWEDGIVRRVFCASLADVFDVEVPQEWREDLWTLICSTPNLEWLLLTKRIESARVMLPSLWLVAPPYNVRLGVTAEDQENADKRIPQLLKVWKGKNFISYEPAIGPIDFAKYLWPIKKTTWSILELAETTAIDWIICGGESGSGCRPMDIEWARSVRDQCKNADTAFFMKQLGGFPDKRHEPELWPEDLRIQEFPE